MAAVRGEDEATDPVLERHRPRLRKHEARARRGFRVRPRRARRTPALRVTFVLDGLAHAIELSGCVRRCLHLG